MTDVISEMRGLTLTGTRWEWGYAWDWDNTHKGSDLISDVVINADSDFPNRLEVMCGDWENGGIFQAQDGAGDKRAIELLPEFRAAALARIDALEAERDRLLSLLRQPFGEAFAFTILELLWQGYLNLYAEGKDEHTQDSFHEAMFAVCKVLLDTVGYDALKDGETDIARRYIRAHANDESKE